MLGYCARDVLACRCILVLGTELGGLLLGKRFADLLNVIVVV